MDVVKMQLKNILLTVTVLLTFSVDQCNLFSKGLKICAAGRPRFNKTVHGVTWVLWKYLQLRLMKIKLDGKCLKQILIDETPEMPST